MKQFDYWMLTEIDQALAAFYSKLFKGSIYQKQLKNIALKQGEIKAKIALDEIHNNKFHPLGKIELTRKRIQEIKDEYNKAAGLSVKDDNSSVVRLLKDVEIPSGNAIYTYRTMGKSLAESWGLNVLFTGTHEQCLDYMKENDLK